MAQTGWAYFGSWHQDPAVALAALQRFVLETGKHKAAFTTQQAKIDHLQSALAKLAVEGDNPVAEILRMQFADQLELVRQRPRPEDPAELLAWVRWLNEPSGTGSILDIVGVSAVPASLRAAPLTESELTQVFNTTRPTKNLVEPLANALLNQRPAGQATYIVVYDEFEPAGYYFTGVTGT